MVRTHPSNRPAGPRARRYLIDPIATRIGPAALAWNVKEADGSKHKRLVGRVVDRTPYNEFATNPADYAYEAQEWDGRTFQPGPNFWRRDQAYEFLTGEPLHDLANP